MEALLANQEYPIKDTLQVNCMTVLGAFMFYSL